MPETAERQPRGFSAIEHAKFVYHQTLCNPVRSGSVITAARDRYSEALKVLEGQQIVFSGSVLELYERDEDGVDSLIALDDEDATSDANAMYFSGQAARVDYIYTITPNSVKARVILLGEGVTDKEDPGIAAAILDLEAANWIQA